MICFTSIIFLMVYWLFFNTQYKLIILNTTTNRLIFSSIIKPGDNLWLVYINSVENLPVAEHYEINNNYKICFTETIYQAPYAGYLNQESAKIVAPGTLRISGYERPMDTVTFYAGAISRHMMFWNGRWLSLYSAAQGGELIRINIEKTFILARLFSKKEVLP